MGESLSISIPLDDAGFMLMQCPRCGGYFKVRSEDYEADDVMELWCPICGLKSDAFWPDEVIELAKAKVLNQCLEDFEETIAQVGRTLSRQPLIRFSVSSQRTQEREGA